MPEMTSQFSGDTTGRCPVGEGPTNTKEGLESFRFSLFPLLIMCSKADGGIAQLARASALQAEGQGFESLAKGTRKTIWSSEIRVHGGCLGAARRRRT